MANWTFLLFFINQRAVEVLKMNTDSWVTWSRWRCPAHCRGLGYMTLQGPFWPQLFNHSIIILIIQNKFQISVCSLHKNPVVSETNALFLGHGFCFQQCLGKTDYSLLYFTWTLYFLYQISEILEHWNFSSFERMLNWLFSPSLFNEQEIIQWSFSIIWGIYSGKTS